MSIRIVSNNSSHTLPLIQILNNYFPAHSNANNQPTPTQNTLFLDTKYFTCTIPIKNDKIFANHNHEDNQKVDMLIFFFDQHEEIENINYNINAWIQVSSPQVMVIIINSANDDAQNQWKYQAEVSQLQAFIPVIYEDLNKIANTIPKWTSSSLLNQGQDQYQIYQLLQMIETCSWSNMEKKTIQKQKTIKNQVETINPELKKREEKKEVVQKKNDQNEGQEEQQQKQMTEQEMQKQMMQFELLMQNMLQIKSMPMNGNERKKKAQDLIMKLAQNLDC